ncbi:hypothetical protein SAMN05444000_109147 [Shimia gijangensis]|uniref:Uncharacterized protein n=1 Tax=Shimia gijangensis TaxID=1470563 RepID=A0A1M6JXA4_9RHOB|nr:hypothetical protein SAMN05444000_109147 [Shimia gijangensis]
MDGQAEATQYIRGKFSVEKNALSSLAPVFKWAEINP